LAYEKAESDIMKLKPRNPVTDNLVTRNLLLRAYFQIGIIETVAGYLGYFVIMIHYGWKPQRLWQLRVDWDSGNNVVDSFGNDWVIIH
jgi:sodium/potassium-transporting ATPase subunit alpha